MAKAVILAVDDGVGARAGLERELTKRYGVDYEVVCLGGAEAALALVGQLKASGRRVALVLVDHWMKPMTGIELLTRVHAVFPTAKRAVLGTWGDTSMRKPVVQATGLAGPSSRRGCSGPSPTSCVR